MYLTDVRRFTESETIEFRKPKKKKYKSFKSKSDKRTFEKISQEILISLAKKRQGFYSLAKSVKISHDDLTEHLRILIPAKKVKVFEHDVDWSKPQLFKGETIKKKITTYKSSDGEIEKITSTKIVNLNKAERTKLWDLETIIYYV